MRHKAFAAAVSIAFALLPLHTFAKPANLTPGQMLSFGDEALRHGFADQALQIANALLLRDANDSAALVIKAQALRLLGQLAESETTARAAWKATSKPGQPEAIEYAAATAVAQALSLQDKRLAAQFWLRRATQAAPSSETRRQAMQDLDYVRQQNPLSLHYNLSLHPTDNVNGGARDPLFVFRGIPFVLSGDTLALSGISWGAGLQGRYRMNASPIDETALTFEISNQGVLLSKDAQNQAPSAKNSAYALDHAEVGVEKTFGIEPAPNMPGQWRLAATLGQTWYAGKLLSVDLGVAAGFERQFEKLAFAGSLNVDKHDRQDHAISSSTDLGLTANLSFLGKSQGRWQTSLSYQRITSEDINVDHQETGLTITWSAGKKLAGIGLGASFGVKEANYSASPYSSTGRQDHRIQAGVTAELSKLSYLGFAPVFGVDYSRADSNLSLYDTKGLGVTLSIKSQF